MIVTINNLICFFNMNVNINLLIDIAISEFKLGCRQLEVIEKICNSWKSFLKKEKLDDVGNIIFSKFE